MGIGWKYTRETRGCVRERGKGSWGAVAECDVVKEAGNERAVAEVECETPSGRLMSEQCGTAAEIRCAKKQRKREDG